MSIQKQIRALVGEKKKVIQEARATLKKEVPFVDIKPYSHNIINFTLRGVAQKVGNTYANHLIDEFELEELGWEKEKEKEDGTAT